MLKLRDITSFLDAKKNGGATIGDFRKEFGDDNMDEVKRLIEAALCLKEIKRDGEKRGVRYYSSNYEIVKIMPSEQKLKANSLDRVDGIDLSDCKNTKEKIDRILSSKLKLNGLYKFSYRQKIESKELNRQLYDFIHKSAMDIDVNLAYNQESGKNYIVSKPSKIVTNRLIVNRVSENEWAITKVFYECPERPETVTFSKYEEFEKCLKTLLSR